MQSRSAKLARRWDTFRSDPASDSRREAPMPLESGLMWVEKAKNSCLGMMDRSLIGPQRHTGCMPSKSYLPRRSTKQNKYEILWNASPCSIESVESGLGIWTAYKVTTITPTVLCVHGSTTSNRTSSLTSIRCRKPTRFETSSR